MSYIKHYERLRALILSLESGQKKLVRGVLEALKHSLDEEGQWLALYNKIVERGDKRPAGIRAAKSAIQAARAEAGKKTDPISERALGEVCTRLSRRILDILLLDLNLDNPKRYDAVFRAQAQLHKRLLQFRILAKQKLSMQAIALLESNIQLAHKFELYSELAENLIEYELILITQGDEKQARLMGERLDRALATNIAFQEARRVHTKVMTSHGNPGIHPEIMGILFHALSATKADSERWDSLRIRYYNLILYHQYYLNVESFGQAVKVSEELIRIVEASESLKSNTALFRANLLLAESLVHTFRFKEAVELFENSLEAYPCGKTNYDAGLTAQAQTHYYMGDLDTAITLFQKLVHEGKKNSAAHARRSHYLASCLFVKGRYAEASKLFEYAFNRLSGEKAGWNPCIRIMLILCTIERNDFDWAKSQIDSLAQYFINADHDGPSAVVPRQREQVVSALLSRLASNGFNFKKLKANHQVRLDLLEDKNREHRWEPLTAECIVYQDWFESKITGKQYQFRVPADLDEWVNEKSIRQSRRHKVDFNSKLEVVRD